MLPFLDSENHNQFRLRWIDQAAGPQEDLVTVLDTHEDEAVFLVRFPLRNSTEVFLSAGGDFQTGVAVSCLPEGEKFSVLIRFVSVTHVPDIDRDPGVLLVDDFLSEEQERLLLEEIEKEWLHPGGNASAAAN